eukprot:Hpha_TRINITY_DN19232_c0_g1::TRINITY_DN19232_c0_g1_i1::g.194325::m.194325
MPALLAWEIAEALGNTPPTPASPPQSEVERVLLQIASGRRVAAAGIGATGGAWNTPVSLLAPDELPPLVVAACGGDVHSAYTRMLPVQGDKPSDDEFQDAVEGVGHALVLCTERASEQGAEKEHWMRREALCLKLLLVLYGQKKHYVYASGLFNKACARYSAIHGADSPHVAQCLRIHIPVLRLLAMFKEADALTRQLADCKKCFPWPHTAHITLEN